jgi:hypothetical protein
VGELNRRIQQVKNKLGDGKITVELTPAQTNEPDAHGREGMGRYNSGTTRYAAISAASTALREDFDPLITDKSQDAIWKAGEFHEPRTSPASGQGSYIKWVGAKRKK